MPISIDEFEGESAGPRTSTNAERILRFLAAHEDQAFTRSEIAAQTDVARNSVGPVLSRLKEQGLVRHRGMYWALAGQRLHAEEIEPPTEHEEEQAEHGDGSTNETEAIPGSHRVAARDFTEQVRTKFGDEIEALYLFGSVARGTERATSDVDVLVVIADSADYRTIDDQLLGSAFEIQLEYEVPVEVHTLRASEFTDRKERREPFVHTVVTEGERRV